MIGNETDLFFCHDGLGGYVITADFDISFRNGLYADDTFDYSGFSRSVRTEKTEHVAAANFQIGVFNGVNVRS